MAYETTAEAVTSPGVPPRAIITVTGIPGEKVIRVDRTAGRETNTVPGSRRLRASGALVITDFFPALNTPTTYTVYVGTQAVGQASLTVTSDWAWLQDPIYPDQAVPVSGHSGADGALALTSDSLQDVSYPTAGQEIEVMGSRYGVVIGSGRRGAQGVNLVASSYDVAMDAAIRELVLDAPILVFRPLPEMVPLPPVAYFHAAFNDQPTTRHWGGPLARFSLSGNLVQAILAAFRSGLATYAQVQAVLGGYTYGEVDAMRAGRRYLDVHKDPTSI